MSASSFLCKHFHGVEKRWIIYPFILPPSLSVSFIPQNSTRQRGHRHHIIPPSTALQKKTDRLTSRVLTPMSTKRAKKKKRLRNQLPITNGTRSAPGNPGRDPWYGFISRKTKLMHERGKGRSYWSYWI